MRNAISDVFSLAGVRPGEFVLVACSGGQDSLALATQVSFVCARDGIRSGAVIIDHGLQPESAKVAERAAEQCRNLRLEPVVVSRVQVEPTGVGLEAAARRARYTELNRQREILGASWILLGHTLDDQAETVLIGLSRGSGIHSIAGMSPINPPYLRPMLEVTRMETSEICEELGVEFWQDPHNTDERFLRSRIRGRVMPLLEAELGPGFSSSLARTAELARIDDAELLRQATLSYEELATAKPEEVRLPVTQLSQQKNPIQLRVIQLACRELGANTTYIQLIGVSELLTNWHGQGSLDLAGVKVERAGEHLVFRKTDSKSSSRDEAEALER